MIRLIASDIDGTLLPYDETVMPQRLFPLIAGAPHPDNARAFLDFAQSRDVQELVVSQFSRRSVRTDVSDGDALPPADELALIDYPVRWAAELKDAFSARWPELLREEAPS